MSDKILLVLTGDQISELDIDSIEAVACAFIENPGAEYAYVDWEEHPVFVVYTGQKPLENNVAQFVLENY